MSSDRHWQPSRLKQHTGATIRLPFLCLSFLLSALWCSAGASTWNGSISSDWFTADNWTPPGVPGAGATIIMTNGTISLASPVTIGGEFDWSGGTLSGDAMIIASGGTMNIAGYVSLFAVLTNEGTVTMTGPANLEMYNDHSAGYDGGVYNLAGARWNIQTNASFGAGSGSGDEFFNNAGNFLKSLGPGTANFAVSFTNTDTGTVSNLAGGLSFNGGGNLLGDYDAASNAAIYFAAGDFTMGALAVIRGSGLCELSGGTLLLTENVPSNLVLAGGSLVLGPAFQNHGAITNLTLNPNCTLTGTNAVTGTLILEGGNLAGPITIESGGMMKIAGSVNLENVLTNTGTVKMTGSANLEIFNTHSGEYNGGVYNLAGALWDIQTNASFGGGSGSGDEFFNNAGNFLKSLGSDTANIEVSFTNTATGTVSNLAGGLSFNAGGALAGDYDIASNAAISFSAGDFTMGTPPVISGSGLCELSGGTLLLTGNVPSNLMLAGGSVVLGSAFQNHGAITNLTLGQNCTLAGTNSVTGTFIWDGGNLAGPITIESAGVMNIAGSVGLENLLTNAGTVKLTGAANLEVYNTHSGEYNGGVYNLPGALWNIQTNASFGSGSGTGYEFFNNAGNFLKSLGSDTANIGVSFTNTATGTVSNLAGTLSFNAGGALAGDYDTVSNAAIYFAAGDFTMGVPPVISGSGLCELSGGMLLLTENVPSNLVLAGGSLVLGPAFQNHGAITNLTFSGNCNLTGTNTVTGALICDGGNLAGPTTIESGGVMNIAGNVGLFNVLTNAGTVKMTGAANLEMYNNHSATYNGGVYNRAAALWDIQTNASFGAGSGSGDEFFNNAGDFLKSLGSDTANIGVSLTNTGTVNALVGTLNFGGGFTTVGGTLAFGVSGTSGFGQIDVVGAVNLNGAVSVAWLDGFTPAVSNSFPLLNYGSHSGTFANIILPSGYLAEGNYGATVFSLLITGMGTQTSKPILSIERIDANMVAVLWPASATNFGLQTTTNLSSTNWNNVNRGITTVGTNDVLTNTIGGTPAFFRLKSE
jgi:hypothetical protein